MKKRALLTVLPLAAKTCVALTGSIASLSTIAVRPDTSDYRALLLSDAPMMDVRAPVEFDNGSFPSARNLPLMTDDERHRVGICYKENGQDAAIELGHKLVCGESKVARVERWTEFARSNPTNGYLFCFRGGLRSRTVQGWLKDEIGVEYPLVQGGYKAMRRFLLDELDRSLSTERSELVIVGGKTGSGKTRIIEKLGQSRSIDLEGLAQHRGSAFGQLPDVPQPSQIDFENTISISLLKLLAEADANCGLLKNGKPQITRLFVEDEGSRIGTVSLPKVLQDKMKSCQKFIVVDEDLEKRVGVIIEDYVLDLGQRYALMYGTDLGPDMHRDRLLDDLKRIGKRLDKKLGGNLSQQLRDTMIAAFKEQRTTGDTFLHRVWIAILLEQYYDPMYDYQITQRDEYVLFRGNCDAVADWAVENSSTK